jgi:hypothetical protein
MLTLLDGDEIYTKIAPVFDRATAFLLITRTLIKVANCPLQHYHPLDYDVVTPLFKANLYYTWRLLLGGTPLHYYMPEDWFTKLHRAIGWSTPQVSVVSHKADTFPTYS